MALWLHLFEDVQEMLIRSDEIGGSLDALHQLAVHILWLHQVVAIDQLHVGVGEKIVRKVVLILELLLVLHRVARDAEDDDAGLLKFFEGVAEAAGFDCAPGSIGTGVKEEYNWLAFEVSKRDVFAVLILQREVFYDVVYLLGFLAIVVELVRGESSQCFFEGG